MGTQQLIKEIKKLPISKRMIIIERTLKSIRERENKNQMEKAAEGLRIDYETDNKLTAFKEKLAKTKKKNIDKLLAEGYKKTKDEDLEITKSFEIADLEF